MTNTYGDKGNRWWVGLNVTSGILDVSGYFKPSGYESLPSGNAKDDAQFAAAAKHNATQKPNVISVENVLWFNINGPYQTQAEANKAIPAIQKANPAPGEFQQITAGGPTGAAKGGGINPNALFGFLSDLTDKNTWVRVAKVVIGSAMLIVGIAKLTGADQKAGSIAAKAVKAAPLL